MTQVGLKMLIWPLVIITVLVFAIGLVEIKKPTYSCFSGKEIHFDKKVEVITLGNFHAYVYPIRHDCDEEDRYDPKTMYKCGVGAYCYRTEE